MYKLISLVALTLSLASAQSHAVEVYRSSAGAWHLTGHTDYRNDNACVFSTRWADGKRVQVNVFVREFGRDNITMTVRNPAWNLDASLIDREFDVSFLFHSTARGEIYKTGRAAIKDDNRIIFRGMNRTFVSEFMRSSSLQLSVSNFNLVINLSGTATLLSELNLCREAVTSHLGGNIGGNY